MYMYTKREIDTIQNNSLIQRTDILMACVIFTACSYSAISIMIFT